MKWNELNEMEQREKENRETIELGNEWCESITKRIGFVKRKAKTAKPTQV